jgi:hypothetical protein
MNQLDDNFDQSQEIFEDPASLDFDQDTELAGVLDSFQSDFSDDYATVGEAGPTLANIVGTPGLDATFWQPQTTGFTCAVMAQCGIIRAFTGEDVSEAELVYEATVNGWLTDQGMSPADVGHLLETHGVPVHQQQAATIEQLIEELAQGHKVIVGVDSGELWNQDTMLEDFFNQAADHAIWVSGVDLNDPNHPLVYVNDSGDPTGAAKAYELPAFMDAWQDSGFFYVATDHAPADLHQMASSYDLATGVFPGLVDYFGLDQLASRADHEDREPDPLAATRDDATDDEDERLGAGICWHCGGKGWTTDFSTGGKERCWYCDGTGVSL